ncbi:MAG: DegT/DnrJ/EryC1/StrS aminotransferase family protein [Candidatus Krumholzibacteriia bacterium]
MREEFLPFSPPDIGEDEIQEVVAALRSGWITSGPRVKRFERDFAETMGAPGALALSSCTAALHLALVLHEVGPGDEVITTPMTFCSTVSVIEHVGARPVLVDVEPDTLNISPAAVAAAVTEQTRAILPVHYAGHPVDLDPIEDLADRHGLVVVEDAAHALPARYRGRMIGSGRNLVAFSFYATKNLTTAEGGMLTGDPDLLERGAVLALHGMNREAWQRYDKGGSWYYEVVLPGFKYNLTDIQAALGLVQLQRLGQMQERRREIVAQYRHAFADLEALELPTERPEVDSAWHLFPVRLRLEALPQGLDREGFIAAMTERNIGTSVHFIPIHLHPYFRDRYEWRPEDFPVAYGAYQRLVSLPLNSVMSDEDVQDVVEAVREIVS